MTKAAKRRKEREGPDFAFPEFDEGDYMRREIEGAKAAVLTVILAIPVAALLYGLAVWGLAIVAFFLGLALTFALPRLFRMLEFLPWPKVDSSKFERRDWLGHGSTFFFSWLAFWILLLNAPFVDLTNPAIGVTVFAGVSPVTMVPGIQNNVPHNSSRPVQFNVTILENVAIANATITVRGFLLEQPLTHVGGNRYEYAWQSPATSSEVEVRALDVNGRASTFGFTLSLV